MDLYRRDCDRSVPGGRRLPLRSTARLLHRSGCGVVRMSDLPIPEPALQTFRTVAVMPAYNAAATLRHTVGDIPPGSVAEVILVDDCSRDDTASIARELGLT